MLQIRLQLRIRLLFPTIPIAFLPLPISSSTHPGSPLPPDALDALLVRGRQRRRAELPHAGQQRPMQRQIRGADGAEDESRVECPEPEQVGRHGQHVGGVVHPSRDDVTPERLPCLQSIFDDVGDRGCRRRRRLMMYAVFAEKNGGVDVEERDREVDDFLSLFGDVERSCSDVGFLYVVQEASTIIGL